MEDHSLVSSRQQKYSPQGLAKELLTSQLNDSRFIALILKQLKSLRRALVQISADIEKRRIRRYLTERKGLPSKQRAQWYL